MNIIFAFGLTNGTNVVFLFFIGTQVTLCNGMRGHYGSILYPFTHAIYMMYIRKK